MSEPTGVHGHRGVSFEEAIAADAQRRNMRALRELLQLVEDPRPTYDTSGMTAEEVACLALKGIAHRLSPTREAAAFLLSLHESPTFRIDSPSVLADLHFLSGQASGPNSTQSAPIAELAAVDRLVSGLDPGPAGWDLLLRSKDPQRMVDEAIDRGLPVPAHAIDAYVAARTVDQEGDPAEFDGQWDEAQEFASLRQVVSEGGPEGLQRLREMRATDWAEPMFRWVQGTKSDPRPDAWMLEREGLWRLAWRHMTNSERAWPLRWAQEQCPSQTFAIWGTQHDCRNRLWRQDWGGAATSARALAQLARDAKDCGTIQVWATTAQCITHLARDDYEGARRLAEVAASASGDAVMTETALRNLNVIEKARPLVGIRSSMHLISPYLLLGVLEDHPDILSARLSQLRCLGNATNTAIILNVAADRAARVDPHAPRPWVSLGRIADPRPQHGLTWRMPRRTPSMGEPDVEEMRGRAWNRLKGQVMHHAQFRVDAAWRSAPALNCDRIKHE